MDPPQQQAFTHRTSTTMERPLPYLPTELKLQIINEVVTFPDGLRSDCSHDDQQAFVNKLSLLSQEMSALVSESLYKVNKVVIKPQPTRPDGTTINGPEVESYGYLAPLPGTPPNNVRPYITYPTTAQSAPVKELEFHLDTANAGIYPTHYISEQFAWLQRLASGELGFPALETIRIVFDHGLGDNGALNLLQHIRRLGQVPIHFAVANVTIVVNGHSCFSGACIHGPEIRFHFDHQFEMKIQEKLQHVLRGRDQQQL